MKKIFYFISCLALAAGFAAGCQDLPAPFETTVPERPITAPIKRVYAKINQEIFEGVIDNEARTIQIQLADPKADVTAIEVHMEIISRAYPAEGCFEEKVLNLTEPYSFYVNNREVDLLYTISVVLPSFTKIDREKCKYVACSGDASCSNTGTLFDGEHMPGFEMFSSISYKFFGWSSNSDTPWFTFDVGESCSIYKIHVYPYYDWTGYDPGLFEIWAYTKAGDVPSTTPSNWKESGDWVQIMNCDVTEQLPLAYKVETREVEPGSDDDPVKNGVEREVSQCLPEGAAFSTPPAARYYRWVVIKSQAGYWGAEALKFKQNGCGAGTDTRVTACCMSELELWKYQF